MYIYHLKKHHTWTSFAYLNTVACKKPQMKVIQSTEPLRQNNPEYMAFSGNWDWGMVTPAMHNSYVYSTTFITWAF